MVVRLLLLCYCGKNTFLFPLSVYLLVGVTAMMLTLAVFYSIPSCDLQLLFHLPQGAADCLKGASNGVTSAVASSSAHAQSSSTPGQSSSSGGARRAGDPERIRLQTAGGGRGPRYTQQLDEHDDEAVSTTSSLYPVS